LLSWRRLQNIGLSGRFPEDKGAIRNLSKPYPRHAIRNPELCHFWDLMLFPRSFILINLLAIDPIFKGLRGRLAILMLFCRMAAKMASRFFSE